MPFAAVSKQQITKEENHEVSGEQGLLQRELPVGHGTRSHVQGPICGSWSSAAVSEQSSVALREPKV